MLNEINTKTCFQRMLPSLKNGNNLGGFHNKSLPKNCTPEVLPFRKVTQAGNQPVSKKLTSNGHNESETEIVLEPCCLSFSPQVIGLMPGKNGQPPYVTCGAKVIPLCLSHITVWIRACWASAVCTHLKSSLMSASESYLSCMPLYRLHHLSVLLVSSFHPCCDPLICPLPEIQSWQK